MKAAFSDWDWTMQQRSLSWWKASSMAMATRMPLFDVHCHLQDPRILSKAPELIRAATDVGVRWIAVNGTSEKDWAIVKQMGEQNPSIIPCFGLHPWWVNERSKDWLRSLRSMLESMPSAAVGEVGLCRSPRGKLVDENLQVEVLKQQLHLARELERPVAVHCVGAYGPLQKLLKEMGSFPAGIILHSYAGSSELVKTFANSGAYFSFSGHNTTVKREKAQRIWREVPSERLLLETDCPFGLPRLDPCSLVWIPGDTEAPTSMSCSGNDDATEEISKSEREKQGGQSPTCRPGKGALNQPANVRALLPHIASLLDVSEEKLADLVFRNAKSLFSFPGSKLLHWLTQPPSTTNSSTILRMFFRRAWGRL